MAQKPMTKTQLVAALAEDMDTDKKSAAAALDAICGLITGGMGYLLFDSYKEYRRIADLHDGQSDEPAEAAAPPAEPEMAEAG